VIEALIDAIGSRGTLVMPTNYDNGVIACTDFGVERVFPPAPPHVPVPWDPATTLSHTGAITNAFWQTAGVVRSRHPTHSVAAWGKLAEEFIEGHDPGTSCCGRDGPYGKMVDFDGTFLYFACALNTTTFWHALDDWLDLPYLPTADVLMKDGDRVTTVKSVKYPEGHRSFYLPSPNKIGPERSKSRAGAGLLRQAHARTEARARLVSMRSQWLSVLYLGARADPQTGEVEVEESQVVTRLFPSSAPFAPCAELANSIRNVSSIT
jgi:hypothetical protein